VIKVFDYDKSLFAGTTNGRRNNFKTGGPAWIPVPSLPFFLLPTFPRLLSLPFPLLVLSPELLFNPARGSRKRAMLKEGKKGTVRKTSLEMTAEYSYRDGADVAPRAPQMNDSKKIMGQGFR